MGCALSHHYVNEHIARTKNEWHLVFEDDAEFKEDWMDMWNEDMYPLMPKDAFVMHIDVDVH